jgi:hypothetical protein
VTYNDNHYESGTSSAPDSQRNCIVQKAVWQKENHENLEIKMADSTCSIFSKAPQHCLQDVGSAAFIKVIASMSKKVSVCCLDLQTNLSDVISTGDFQIGDACGLSHVEQARSGGRAARCVCEHGSGRACPEPAPESHSG